VKFKLTHYQKANGVPFSRLASETLVWKLAAIVQFVCTGSSTYNHHIKSDDLPTIFEQMLTQLQDLPESPEPYRLQQSEPELTSELPVRLIIGFSGSGKTAWSSQLAVHTSSIIAYYDVGDTTNQNLASSITRELAGRFLGHIKDSISIILLPGMTGLDSLRALGKLLELHKIQAIVIIDNVHRLLPSQVRDIIRATPTINYVLLAQPWPLQVELEAFFNIKAETLKGWSIDTIAAEFTDNGCVINPATSFKISKETRRAEFHVPSTWVNVCDGDMR